MHYSCNDICSRSYLRTSPLDRLRHSLDLGIQVDKSKSQTLDHMTRDKCIFLSSLLQNFQEWRRLHCKTADTLNLSNQESTCIVLFHDHKCLHCDTSISGCIQHHWGRVSHKSSQGNQESMYRSRFRAYKSHEHRSTSGYSSVQTFHEDTLYRIASQSSPAYKDTAPSRDDKVYHPHNHISPDIFHHSNQLYKTLGMHFLGTLGSKHTSPRIDRKIRCRSNTLDRAYHSWDRLGRKAVPANLDHKCSFQILDGMIR